MSPETASSARVTPKAERVAKVKAAGVEVNDADKAAFVAASQPIYDAFAQQVPGGADLVSKAQALAK